ncbi:MAG: XdhC family protein, partial [Flavobacteriales bacterium]
MNNPRDFWNKVLLAVQAGEACVLLCVVESIGSSPGRKGFKMCVTSSGTMFGSIGGGSMEHKLVELARSLMDKPAEFPFLKRQIHQAGIGQDRSGMICSGEQTVAFFHFVHPVNQATLVNIVDAVDAGAPRVLELSSRGIHVSSEPSLTALEGETEWSYREPLLEQSRIAIIGGGHVSLALSRTMNQLGFHVHVLDDRDGLNTMREN